MWPSVARDAAAVVATVADLTQKGITATGQAIDVGDGAAIKTWVETVGTALGGLDIVVSNVSGFGITPDDTGWRQSFEIDVMRTVHTVEAFMPFLEASDTAAIVVFSSIVAVESVSDVALPGWYWPYAAMKAALTNYMASLSSTLAPKDIRANTVTAGAIYFPGGVWHRREQEAPRVFKKVVAHCRMGRLGRSEEVAKAVVSLASPAASYIQPRVILRGRI